MIQIIEALFIGCFVGMSFIILTHDYWCKWKKKAQPKARRKT